MAKAATMVSSIWVRVQDMVQIHPIPILIHVLDLTRAKAVTTMTVPDLARAKTLAASFFPVGAKVVKLTTASSI